MMNSAKRLQIVFAGGGTAGHLFPGLAVAEELNALAVRPRIVFAGSGKAFEERLVREAGFEYVAMRCSPLRTGLRGMWRFVGENLAGYREARRFLRAQQIDAVVGLGGYASAACARAAISDEIPLVAMEQNAIPGKATRWLARHADLICVANEEAARELRAIGPVCVTGNPIRAGFRRPVRPIELRRSQRGGWQHRLLVIGGSGGARSLNENVPKALYKLRDLLDGWQIVHQTGAGDGGKTRELYRKLALPAIAVPFVKNMPAVMRRTAVAVCRAGGSTLSELAATGLPAVLVPYPHAASNHQRLNAEVIAAAGGARIVDERATTGRLDDAIADALGHLLADSLLRQRMSAAVQSLARPDAARRIARMVYELAHQRAGRQAA